MPTRIDEYSLAAVPVQQFRDDVPFGHATAFVWEKNSKFYLITNWHVVTCRNCETTKCLLEHAGVPNRLNVRFHSRRGQFEAREQSVSLFTADGKPTWFVHPVHRHQVDVVAIPLSQAQGDQFYLAINKLSRELLSIQVGMDVFVIGFPFTPRAPWLPVWKRGSIASEPEMVGLADPYHLVDTASRPGMSGAPVVLRSYGTHLTESGPSGTTAPATRFFGIYSGRLHTKEREDAQLGRVWPERTIIEIIEAEFRDPGGWD